MKANELMIFDLVRRKKDNRTMIVVEVGYDENIGAITPDDRYYGDYEDYHESEVGPILLTPEILEKNFGSALNGCYFEGDEFYELMIHEVNDGTWIIKHDNIEFSNIPRQQVMVSYVHELQHALRICGIEKEIDLC